jgi:RNA polymerase sigma-70 factor (ECF subfamily)
MVDRQQTVDPEQTETRTHRQIGLPEADFAAAVALARAGEPSGFASLFQGYNRAVVATVRSSDTPNAADAVNRVFLKAFRSIDRFVGSRQDFAALLYRLTAFELQDHRPGPDEDLPAPGEDSRRALQSLTPEQRELIVLRVYFGLSVGEAAAALGRPLSSVRSLQSRAEARLRLLAGPVS